jgi:hypothetical protein
LGQKENQTKSESICRVNLLIAESFSWCYKQAGEHANNTRNSSANCATKEIKMSKAIFDYVTKLAEQLSFEERQKLIERLSQPLQSTSAQTVDLYGTWRGKFPQEIDLDETLKEIRSSWQSEWSEKEFRG